MDHLPALTAEVDRLERRMNGYARMAADDIADGRRPSRGLVVNYMNARREHSEALNNLTRTLGMPIGADQ